MILNKLWLLLLLTNLLPSTLAAQNLWSDDFESTSAPTWDYGSTWSKATGNAANSGLSNIQHKGNSPSSLLSPSLDFSQASKISIAYFARRSGSYPQSGLRVWASIDGGAQFNILVIDSLAALPSKDGSTYVLIESDVNTQLSNHAEVLFKFEAFGGSSGASIIRIDDFVVRGSGIIPHNTAGLSSPEQAALNSEFGLGLDLELQKTGAGVSGLEFDVLLDDALTRYAGLEVGDILSNDDWTVDVETDSNRVRVVALSQGSAKLSNGSYTDLVTLNFEAIDIGSSEFELDRILASESDPRGGSIAIRLGTSTTTTEIRDNASNFDISIDSLNYGSLRHELSHPVDFWISNRNGLRDLNVRLASSISEISIEPSQASIVSGDSLLFSARMDARAAETGITQAWVLIGHNGPENEFRLPVSATISPWRGDSNSDQEVNLLDLVRGIHIVLGRHDANREEIFSADNFPFNSEDGLVDIRDLTVLVFALLNESWPDDSSLPRAEKSPAKSIDLQDLATGSVEPKWEWNANGLSLQFDYSDQIQALFFEGNAGLMESRSFHSESKRKTNTIQSIAFKMTDSFTSSDSLRFDFQEGPTGIQNAYAVTNSGEYLWVDLSGLSDIPNEQIGIELYPNPMSASKSRTLQISLDGPNTSNVQILLYNVLGQLVDHLITDQIGQAEWEAKDHSPGLYFLRAESERQTETKYFVLLE